MHAFSLSYCNTIKVFLDSLFLMLIKLFCNVMFKVLHSASICLTIVNLHYPAIGIHILALMGHTFPLIDEHIAEIFMENVG